MRDITIGDTFFAAFTTRAFATGVPTVLAGTPVVSAYEDGGLVQITAGITLGVDHDGVVGLNMLTVVATGANGYEAGKDYALVITTGTVGGVSVVGEVVAEFSIGRSAAAVDLANGTDGLGAIKTDTAAILVDTGTTLDGRIPAALVSGRMDASVGAMATGVVTATAIAADAIGASEFAADAVAEIADAIWDEDATGHQTLGTYGQAIGDPVADTNTIYKAVVTDAAGATIGADIVEIEGQTDDIGAAGAGLTALATQASVNTIDGIVDAILLDTAEIGTAGAGLTAVPGNAAWDAETESEVLDALNTILADSIPADGTLPTVRQALYLLTQFMLERAVSGTTVTVKKADGSTTLFTLTLDNATTPTSITRAT